MRLRPATLADLPVLHAWDRNAHVIASGGDDDVFDWEHEVPREVFWREILIAEADGRAIGVMVVIDPAEEETHYWGDCEPGLRAIDIWIGDERDLGRGYGTQMMRLALDRCFEAPAVNAVLIDPLARNTAAHRFYERLGFRRIERRIFGTDDCYVYRITRAEWHDARAHLQHRGSD